jgi:hypothetical protein
MSRSLAANVGGIAVHIGARVASLASAGEVLVSSTVKDLVAGSGLRNLRHFLAGEMLADARTGRNGRNALVGLLRQSVSGRLAGYEDVNDAERLRYDPRLSCRKAGKARIFMLVREVATRSGRASSPASTGRAATPRG